MIGKRNIPNVLSDDDLMLVKAGFLFIDEKSNGEIVTELNLTCVLDLIHFVSEIPLSLQNYTQIVNSKNKKPEEIKSILLAALAKSFLLYYLKNRDINEFRSTDEDMMNIIIAPYDILAIIDKFFCIEPNKKADIPRFLWFYPDQIKLRNLEESERKQDKKKFPNYSWGKTLFDHIDSLPDSIKYF